MLAVCLVPESRAQGDLAPLQLFINGSGSVTPLQSGQLLEVGQSYEMTAIPDPGFVFSSWQPVNAFTFTQTNFDVNGNPILPPVVSVDPSQIPQYTYNPVLDFTMQPVEDITTNGSNPNITEEPGWQANFVPVPEPSGIRLIISGLAAIALLQARRFRQWRWKL